MPVTKVKSKWSSGNLVFYETGSGIELLKINNARQYELNEIAVTSVFASAEAFSGMWTIAPHSGVISKVAVVNTNNATGAVTFTVFASAVSAGQLAFATGDASGTVATLEPAAAVGAIDEDGAVKFLASGNQTGTFPVTVMAIIRR